MEPNESSILAQDAIRVTFGEKPYDIKPLTIRKSREWRKLLVESLQQIVTNFQGKITEVPEVASLLSSGLVNALVRFPEKQAELLFAYAPNLPAEEILDTATEKQVQVAFSEVMRLAFPFLSDLRQVTEIVQANSAAKDSYLN